MITVPTMAPEPTISAADRAAITNRCVDIWAASLHTLSDTELAQEEKRVEYQQRSPVADRMRHEVAAELAARGGER